MTNEPLLQEFSIDDAVNQIGLGKFHYKMLFLIYLNYLQQNLQCALPGLILPSLTTEFELSRAETSLYGMFEYLGFFFGSLTIGKISNKLGRRNTTIVSQTTWLFAMLLSILSPNIYVFMFLRCIISISFMYVVFCGYSTLSEIWPQKTRGIVLNFIFIIANFAYIINYLIARFIFLDLKTADWRALCLIYSSILAISLGLNYNFLFESPRYDLFIGKKKQSFETLKRMASENLNEDNYLENGKSEQIQNWSDHFNKDLDLLLGPLSKENVWLKNFNELFKGSYKNITIIMFILWTIISSSFFGSEFILLTILLKISEESNENPLDLSLEIYCFVIVTMLFFIAMVEMKYFGRKKTLAIIFFIMGTSGIGIYFKIFSGLFFWFCFFKLSLSSSFMVIYLYTCELYPTRLRMNAIGQISAISRIGVIIMVWFAVYMLDIQLLLPFLIYGIMGFVAFITINLLPYDTLGEDIDRVILN